MEKRYHLLEKVKNITMVDVWYLNGTARSYSTVETKMVDQLKGF